MYYTDPLYIKPIYNRLVSFGDPCRYQPGYNIGFGLFGGFAPLLAEASLEWSPYGPGLLLSLAGFVTVVTIVGSVHLLEHGKVLGKNWFIGC